MSNFTVTFFCKRNLHNSSSKRRHFAGHILLICLFLYKGDSAGAGYCILFLFKERDLAPW